MQQSLLLSQGILHQGILPQGILPQGILPQRLLFQSLSSRLLENPISIIEWLDTTTMITMEFIIKGSILLRPIWDFIIRHHWISDNTIMFSKPLRINHPIDILENYPVEIIFSDDIDDFDDIDDSDMTITGIKNHPKLLGWAAKNNAQVSHVYIQTVEDLTYCSELQGVQILEFLDDGEYGDALIIPKELLLFIQDNFTRNKTLSTCKKLILTKFAVEELKILEFESVQNSTNLTTLDFNSSFTYERSNTINYRLKLF